MLKRFFFVAFLLPALLAAQEWHFSNGPEFKGAKGKLTSGQKTFLLEGDFTGGGSYVAMYHDFREPKNLLLFRFSVRGKASRVAVRFTDSGGQTHQHFLPLTGEREWEEVAIRVTGSAEHHWGGRNDGILRPPVRRVAIVTHRGDYANNRAAALEVKDIRLDFVREQSEHGFVMPQELNKSYCSWRFNNGPEFKGGERSGALSASGHAPAGGGFHRRRQLCGGAVRFPDSAVADGRGVPGEERLKGA